MRRVLIISSYHLFGHGVASLLDRQKNVEIVGWETDVDQAVQKVKMLHPDVVIVDSADPDCILAPCTVRLLSEEIGATIIGLYLESNAMTIIRKEERTIREVGDLVQAID
jgi:DNA-binding NarL/FixJ family response regulator